MHMGIIIVGTLCTFLFILIILGAVNLFRK
jgi:hypothetical protein